jgi:hypothetical protein
MTSILFNTNLLSIYQTTRLRGLTLKNTAVLKIWSIIIVTIEGRHEAARLSKPTLKSRIGKVEVKINSFLSVDIN